MAKRKVRQKKDIPPDETKASRFVRVVKPRVNRAIRAISVIGYCSGSTYEYTPEQVQDITEALAKEVVTLESKFAQKKSKQDEFKFNTA